MNKQLYFIKIPFKIIYPADECFVYWHLHDHYQPLVLVVRNISIKTPCQTFLSSDEWSAFGRINTQTINLDYAHILCKLIPLWTTVKYLLSWYSFQFSKALKCFSLNKTTLYSTYNEVWCSKTCILWFRHLV
jgi:hypothetical protein